MKILHINTFNQQGGAETIAHSLFLENPDNSFLVKNNTICENNVHEFKSNIIDIFFDFLTKLKWRLKPDYSFKKVFFIEEQFNFTFQKLNQLDLYKNADIIHLHNIHGGYFDLAALKKIAREKKIVWTLHDMWCMTGGEAHTFENENYKIGIGKTPYLHVPPLNNPLIDRRQYFLELKKNIYQEISRNIIFVPVSNWLNNCLTSSYVWNEQLKSSVIHNGIDTNTFFLNRKIQNSIPKILIFNSSNIFKGEGSFKEILESINMPFELFVIGNSISILNNNLKKMELSTAIKSRVELSKLYNSVDILLFPSKADNFPLVPLEAMACGVCVFASNTGGIPEMIEHNKTGFLFDTPKELILNINTVLKDSNTINEIGNNASIDVTNRFSLNSMIKKYNDLYRKILG